MIASALVHRNAKLVALGEDEMVTVYSVFQGLQVSRCASVKLSTAVLAVTLRPVGDGLHDKGVKKCRLAVMDGTRLEIRMLECASSSSSSSSSKSNRAAVWREAPAMLDMPGTFRCDFPELDGCPAPSTALVFVSDARVVVVRGDLIYVVTLPTPSIPHLSKIDVRQLECMTSTGRTLRSLRRSGTSRVEKLLLGSRTQESFVVLMRHNQTDMVDVQWVDVLEENHNDENRNKGKNDRKSGDEEEVASKTKITSLGLAALQLVVRWSFSTLHLHSSPVAVDEESEVVFACADDGVHVMSRFGPVRVITHDTLASMKPLTSISLYENYPNTGAYRCTGLIVSGAAGSFALLEACVKGPQDEGLEAHDTCSPLHPVPLCALVGKGSSSAAHSHVHTVETICQLPEQEELMVVASHPSLGLQTLVFQSSLETTLSSHVMRRVMRYMCGSFGTIFDRLHGTSSVFVSNVSLNADARPAEMLLLTGGSGGVGSTVNRCEDAAELVSLDSLTLNMEDEGVRMFTASPAPLQQLYGPHNGDNLHSLPLLVSSRTTQQSILMDLSVSVGGEIPLDDENIDDEVDEGGADEEGNGMKQNDKGAEQGQEHVCGVTTAPLMYLTPCQHGGPPGAVVPSIDDTHHTLLFTHIGNGAAVQVTTHSVCVVDCVTRHRRGPLCPIKACRTDARRGQNRGAIFDTAEHAALAASCQHLCCSDGEAAMHAHLEACEAFVAVTNGKFVMVLSVNSVSGQVHYVTHYAMEEDVSAIGALRVITEVTRETPVRISMTLVIAVGCWGRDGVALLVWHGEVDRREIDSAISSPRGVKVGTSGVGKLSPRGSPRPSQSATDLTLRYVVPFEQVGGGGGDGDDEYIRTYGSLRHVLLAAATDIVEVMEKPRARDGKGVPFTPPNDLKIILTCVNGAGDIMIVNLRCGRGRNNYGLQDSTAGSLLTGTWSHQPVARYLLRGGVVDVVSLDVAPYRSTGVPHGAALGFLINGTSTDHILYAMVSSVGDISWRCDRIAASSPGRRANFMALPMSLLAEYVPEPPRGVLPADGVSAYPPNLVQHLLFAWTDGYGLTPASRRSAPLRQPSLRIGAILPSSRVTIQASHVLPGKVVSASMHSDLRGSAVRQPTPHVFKTHRHTSFKTFAPDKTAMLFVLWRATTSWGVAKFDSSSLKCTWKLERARTAESAYENVFACVAGPFPYMPGSKRPPGLATAEFGETFSLWFLNDKSDGGGITATAIYPHGRSNHSFRALGEVTIWKDKPGACKTVPVCLSFEMDGPDNFSGVLVASQGTISIVAWERHFKDAVLNRATTTLSLAEVCSLDVPSQAHVLEAVVAAQRSSTAEKERTVFAVSRRGWGVDLLEFSAQGRSLSLLRTVSYTAGGLTNLSLTLDPPQKSVGLGIYGPTPRVTAQLLCVDSKRAHELRDYKIELFEEGRQQKNTKTIQDVLECRPFGWHKASLQAAADNEDGPRCISTPPVKIVTTYSLESPANGRAPQEYANYFAVFGQGPRVRYIAPTGSL